MELAASGTPTQLEHEDMRDQLVKAKSNLSTNLGTINTLADHLYGDSHGPAEIDLDNSKPERASRAGLVGQLRDELDGLDYLIADVQQALSRLQR